MREREREREIIAINENYRKKKQFKYNSTKLLTCAVVHSRCVVVVVLIVVEK